MKFIRKRHPQRDYLEEGMALDPEFTKPYNQYGLVVGVNEDGSELPLCCNHGGSMWLCPECADKAVSDTLHLSNEASTTAEPNPKSLSAITATRP